MKRESSFQLVYLKNIIVFCILFKKMMSDSNFKLMQWNTLSRSEQFCSKTSFPRVEDTFLEWTYRSKLFKSIFEKVNPDILCLQEVDDYDEFRENLLSESKYDSAYFKKKEGVQGIAFFYDKEKFNLLKIEQITLPDSEGQPSNQFFIYAFLEELKTNSTFCVISTHLKAKVEFESTRINQVKFILDFIDNNPQFLDFYTQQNPKGVIITGDFNAEPTYSSIQYLLDYKFKTNQSIVDENLISAYNFLDKNKEDYIEMTTFKYRKEESYRVIDYIFHTQGIKMNKVTPTMKKSESKFLKEDISEVGLPCSFFPSDHYYLIMEFGLV